MSELLALMANLMRPDELGPAEVGYRAMAKLGRPAPRPGARRPLQRPEGAAQLGGLSQAAPALDPPTRRPARVETSWARRMGSKAPLDA